MIKRKLLHDALFVLRKCTDPVVRLPFCNSTSPKWIISKKVHIQSTQGHQSVHKVETLLKKAFQRVSLSSAIALGLVKCEEAKQQFKLPDAKDMTPKQVLQQSCAVTVAATVQLLQLTTAAVINASNAYRDTMAAELLLLNRCLEFVNVSFMQDEFNDLLIIARADIQHARSDLQEVLGMMEYVEKLAGSAAETSFMAGAEYSSFSLSEILVNAQRQVSEHQVQVREMEAELRNMQHQLVLRASKPETPVEQEQDAEPN